MSGSLAFLISPGGGLFVYMPILVLVFWGIGPFYKALPREALFFAAFLLILLLVHAGYRPWTGGLTWGPRFLMPALALMIPFIGFAQRTRVFRRPAAKPLVAALMALSVVIQVPAVIVPWQRYLIEVAALEAEGRHLNTAWNLRDAYPVRQWGQVADVLSMDAGNRRLMRYHASEQDLPPREYLNQSLALNVPDFWFVHARYLGVPLGLVIVPIVVLTGVAGICAALLWRRIRNTGAEPQELRA